MTFPTVSFMTANQETLEQFVTLANQLKDTYKIIYWVPSSMYFTPERGVKKNLAFAFDDEHQADIETTASIIKETASILIMDIGHTYLYSIHETLKKYAKHIPKLVYYNKLTNCINSKDYAEDHRLVKVLGSSEAVLFSCEDIFAKPLSLQVYIKPPTVNAACLNIKVDKIISIQRKHCLKNCECRHKKIKIEKGKEINQIKIIVQRYLKENASQLDEKKSSIQHIEPKYTYKQAIPGYKKLAFVSIACIVIMIFFKSFIARPT